MAAYAALGSIWRRSRYYGGGVSNLVRGNVVSRSFSSLVSSGRMSPWLMLPPATEDGSMVYKFFSLAENRVLSFDWSDVAEDCSDFDPTDKDAQLVGFSKGWVCLTNNRTRQMDLINPITRRRLKLPSLEMLGRVSASKIILTSSPDVEDEGECRCALIAYDDDEDQLAFCCPGQSYTWTPIANHDDYLVRSFAYSRRQKLVFCVKSRRTCELHGWDLRDPLSPKMMTRMDLSIERWGDLPRFLLESNEDIAHFWERWDSYLLVVNEDTDDLFVLMQFVKLDDYGCEDLETTIFDVYKYDRESGTFKYMDRSLDGLSFFIGDDMNNGFALSAEEFPELKPDSIYFVLNHDWFPSERQNVGILNYKDATISPLCDLPSFRTFKPALGWFTPNTSN